MVLLRIISNGRKGRFQSLEAGLLMGGRTGWDYGLPYTGMVDKAITGLQDYTLFLAPWISETKYLCYIFY